MNSQTCSYCFLDIDIANHRSKLGTAAAFVDATDSRYGFSSKNFRYLGGSEIARIKDLIATDHEWASKDADCGGIVTKAPTFGQRIVVKLFWDVAPLACENFATLCANGSITPGKKPKPPPVGECGKPLTYRGSTIHRVIPGFVIQGGDFVFGNGSGGESVFGKKTFKDERAGLAMKHDRKGLLSMGNSGKNSNSSQFFFTLSQTPQCDGKHVVFGEVVSGIDILDEIEEHGTSTGTPAVSIKITDCGIFRPMETPGSGYWYDQPDPESYSGVSPAFIVRPRIACIAPTKVALEKFKSALAVCSVVAGLTTTDDEEGQRESATVINKLLETFAVDLVVLAPACKTIKALIVLPPNWIFVGGGKPTLEEVILETKPIQALSTIHSQSWISKQSNWQLDGIL